MDPVNTVGLLSPWEPGIFSLVLFGALVVGIITVLHYISAVIGEQKPGIEKSRVYESGIIPTGSARLRYPVPFFLVAIFFLIFDIEGAFIFAWAAAMGDLGWAGWFQISFFIIVLLIGLLYIWRKGGLEWGPKPGK
ncbi:MAG: NADH-quinone oxidoreductase subunit A [Desulfobacteraceae bacterium]|nr:NADH-quinone oxidoreductase subunit A [Desulfobacteraceae bacterium]